MTKLLLILALAGPACLPAKAKAPEAKAPFLQGLALERARDYQGALAQFQAALDQDPNNSDAQRQMGNCHYFLGDLDQAKEDYEGYLSVHPEDAKLEKFVARIDKQKADMERAKLPNVLTKSWYVYNGLGASFPEYPSSLKEQAAPYEAAYPDHFSLSLDLLGFYYAFKPEKLLLGVIIDGEGDSYQNTSNTANSHVFQINQYLYSASAMYFPGQGVGQGIFFRADLGYAALRALQDSSLAISHDGYGALLGTGYAFCIAKRLSVILNANYAWRQMRNESYGSPHVGLGVLF